MPDCSLCRSDLAPILGESTYWRLVLNTNQNLLGKCFLVLRRHVESVTALSAAEWSALQPEIARATHILEVAFRPDHFNYAFLQNQDRHVHLHILPRYATERRFEGLLFWDPEYPSHYDPSHTQRLPEAQLTSLANTLRHSLTAQGTISDAD